MCAHVDRNWRISREKKPRKKIDWCVKNAGHRLCMGNVCSFWWPPDMVVRSSADNVTSRVASMCAWRIKIRAKPLGLFTWAKIHVMGLGISETGSYLKITLEGSPCHFKTPCIYVTVERFENLRLNLFHFRCLSSVSVFSVLSHPLSFMAYYSLFGVFLSLKTIIFKFPSIWKVLILSVVKITQSTVIEPL